MNNPQLLKGVLDGCVLELISRQEIYGYDLIKGLQDKGFSDIKGGTVYPLLQKLEKNQLISGKSRPSPEGPNRKYFTITEKGLKELEQFIMQWQHLTEIVQKVFEEDGKNEHE